MNPTFQELMREATRLTRGGHLAAATDAIQRALGGAAAAAPAPDPRSPSAAMQAKATLDPPTARSVVLEGCVFEVVDRVEPGPASAPDFADTPCTGSSREGKFGSGVHTHASLTRHYKLFVPPGAAGRSLPLVVMLHGCTQGPDDFAAGTGMNDLAREMGFYVLYPAQAQDANPSRCWNWFKHNHQTRERGETAVIATMTHAVVQAHGIDPERVYIAGLSAGGAMAALVAAAYPETFAAVGVHSGLPPGAARSLPQGLAAMRTGTGGATLPAGIPVHMRSQASPAPAAELPVPAIVFHGDQDQTVHPRNGEQVVAAVLASRVRSAASTDSRPIIEQGVSTQGRRYTRSTHRSDTGQPIAEHWLLHGAGHAWSGGNTAGSYTDAQGPDASREMLRFFFEQASPRKS
ncbi:MAG: extracellular catalytic domain type 1 short-chain-length polyhydroxyalkanoate depolymerase [Rubrivivax sp.]